eukprot:Colp12_sorted_trinity150504_noHs@13400
MGPAAPFMTTFKKFKNRGFENYLNEVYDFSNLDKTSDDLRATIVEKVLTSNDDPIEFGTRPQLNGRKAYSIAGLEGFTFIPNVFSPDEHKYWLTKCLSEYSKAPNVSNLDIHYDRLGTYVF